jgi:hypothetical protein
VTQFDRKNVTFYNFDNSYEYDALQYTPFTFTQASITAALTAIGVVNKATLLLRPGTWVISSNADWSAYTNVTFKIVPGAVLQIADATTTTFGGPVEAGLYQIFHCDGTGNAAGLRESNPYWFGGSPSASATVNTASIQKAVDSLTAGGVLCIPPGNWGWENDIIFTKSATIKGDGFSSTKITWTPTAPTNGMIALQGANHYEVYGIRFDGSWNGITTYSGAHKIITTYDTNNPLSVSVHDCYFENARAEAINLYGGKVFVYNNYLNTGVQDAINPVASYNEVYGNIISGFLTGIETQAVNAYGNTITTGTTGIVLSSSSEIDQQSSITGNKIYCKTGMQLAGQGGTVPIKNVVISGNTITKYGTDHDTHGIIVTKGTSTTDHDNILITGNTIKDFWVGVWYEYANNIHVKNNIITLDVTNASSAAVERVISDTVENSVIDGNDVYASALTNVPNVLISASGLLGGRIGSSNTLNGTSLGSGRNLLLDGDLQTWGSATDLTSWTETISTGNTVDREAAELLQGTYSLKLTRGNAAGTLHISQIVEAPECVGKYATLVVWSKASAVDHAEARIVCDAVDTHLAVNSGIGNWEKYYYTFKPTASTIDIILGNITTVGDVYYGAVLLLYGVSSPDYWEVSR